MSEIKNRVVSGSTVTFDLGDYYHPAERLSYDMAQHLFQGLILREKDFRKDVKEQNWANFKGKNVHIFCSADAIIPTWAYMTVLAHLHLYANCALIGSAELLENELYKRAFLKINFSDFEGKKVVIKGCNDHELPASIYGLATEELAVKAKLIMYGEPCSNVPVFKKPKTAV